MFSYQHFQRDIVRGVEGFIVTGTKQVEIGKLMTAKITIAIFHNINNQYVLLSVGTKLSEDSRKYGAENTCTSGSALSKAAMSYSSARMDIEKERENLVKALGT